MLTKSQFTADAKTISEQLHDSALKIAQSTGVPWKKAAPPRQTEFLSILSNLTAGERKMLTAKTNRAALEAIAHREPTDNQTVLDFMKKRSTEFIVNGESKTKNPKRLYSKPWKRKTAMMLLALIDYKPAKKRAKKSSAKKVAA